MATYCRITGKSRGLPKPNYFPLLPPISPADAKRLCRITGKAVGQPTHHYLPVLLSKTSNKKEKKINDNLHKILPGYRYLSPCLNSNSAEILTKLLATKRNDSNSCYVYTIREKQCGLIFSAKLEAAVRDGDIKDVMLAKDQDLLLLKLKKGPDVSLEISEINIEKLELLEGKGVTKIIRRKKSTTDTLCKIFEDKENIAEKEAEIKLIKPKKNKKRKWRSVEEIEFKEEFIKEIKFDKWYWNDFNDCESYEKIITKLPNPIFLKPLNVDLKEAKPGLIQQPCFTDCISLKTAAVVAPFKPLIVEPDERIIECIRSFDSTKLEETLYIDLLSRKDNILPSLEDIPNIIKLLNKGVNVTEDFENHKIHGVEIVIDGTKKFIVGQLIETQDGPQFIPGHTIITSSGQMFIPGITTNTEEGPKLLPGCIVEIEGKTEFIAGQWTLTNLGEKFVQGQILKTDTGLKFTPGQTVTVDGMLKFIPGQIYEDRFVPGQILNTDEGLKFIPGQTIDNKFIPGLSMWSEKGWEFIPGITDKKTGNFIPGTIVNNLENPNGIYVPGQFVKDGYKEIFIPGITIGDNELKFVCGTTIQTPEGNQFIQGQVVETSNGMKFIPGYTDIQNGDVIFQAANNLQDLKYEDAHIESFTKQELYPDGVFGQMVQSSQGVEFFPGEANCLPKGKVVPGKLIRGAEVKFIPGLMIDGSFVPGQVVLTEEGEQFIPGQVIETTEGPKFVPGQIIRTKDGEKFIPGQTIKTENGPKFIPGQIIETKVGPTFIPGQVIHTDDGLSRFVPGEVLETIEGPRFVPGRVVEAGDYVTFLPGQVVHTNEGLRFIAPDLIYSEQEEQHFTLQSFEILPEELNLIKPNGTNITIGDMIIDSKMFRQLSEAGMGIGNQVSAEIPEVSVRSAPAMSIACSLGQRLKLDPVTTVKVSQIIAAIVKIGKLGEIQGNTEEIQTLNRILERVIHCKNDEEAYKLISNIIEKEFFNNLVENVDKLHAYVVSHESPLKKLNKINIMKELLNCNVSNVKILEKLVLIMNEEDDTVSSALQRIHEVQPEIVSVIIDRFMESVGKLENERDVIDTLHKSIVSSIRETSEMCIVDLMKDTENIALKTLILEAVALAKALDMNDTAVTLLNLLSNPKCTNILAGDRIILEILKKLTIMKKLAEKNPEFLLALKNLNIDPYKARSDPYLVQLAKESQALLVIPEEDNLESSKNIPTSLLFSQNSLAMEEYLSRTKRLYRILVIIKNGIQAIIPREASHSVLTGSVPYAVLDEKGLHYFQPKHVFTALKLPKIATNWFSLYKCEFKDIANNNIPLSNALIDAN